MTQGFILLNAIIFYFLLFASNIFSQEERDYNISPRAYGITYDGTYLYYLDSERRALIRFDSNGREEIFNIGLAGMKGITFDTREGRLLVTAPKFILKLDPNTGGIVDRIQIPLENIGGIASVDGLYYLLDLTDGRVHFYDKASQMIVGGFYTDRTAPKDLSYGKESLWISDSSNGMIYRYNPNTGKITGSIQAPASDLRGLLFSGSKIWIVDRGSRKIKSIPFVETDRFLASGETNYKITYRLTYNLPSVSLADAEVGILLPPSNEHQRVRNLICKDKDFKNGSVYRNRAFVKKLNIESDKGTQVTEISLDVRLTSMTYFVDDKFLRKREVIPEELNEFRDPSKENIQLSPEDQLILFNRSFRAAKTPQIYSNLLENGFPVITGKKIIYKEGSEIAEVTDYLSGYLPGFGWIPYSPLYKISDDKNKIFEYTDKEIVLFQSFNKEFVASPVFFKAKGDENWKNIPTKWAVSIRRIKN